MSKYEPASIVHNVNCMDCGTLMKTAEVNEVGEVYCRRCIYGGPLNFCGNSNSGHYDDDPSGASGSWDQAVKGYEGP